MKQIIIDNIGTSYYITPDGRCYNSITNKYLKGQINARNGYLSYYLNLKGGRKRKYAHRLVAEAYIPNPAHKPEVNHLDGNKQNNNVSNLEWTTSAENKLYAIELGLRATRLVYCFTPDKKLVACYRSAAEACRAVNISISVLGGELRKPLKSLCGGFYWSYDCEIGPTYQYENTGRAKPVNQYTREGKFIVSYPSLSAAARAQNCSISHIGECCREKLKTYKGFIWRYADDIVLSLDENQSAPQEQ